MEFTGHIKNVSQTFQVTPTFRNRKIVVATSDQYPQFIEFEFHQDKCDLLDDFIEGEEVVIKFNLRGREWVNPQGEKRYFNSLVGWAINRTIHAAQNSHYSASAPQNSTPQPQQQSFPSSQQAQSASFEEEEHDDLPF